MNNFFKDTPHLEDYATTITSEYHRWSKLYQEAFDGGSTVKMGIAAFMCNAISGQILKCSHTCVREYFYHHAHDC